MARGLGQPCMACGLGQPCMARQHGQGFSSLPPQFGVVRVADHLATPVALCSLRDKQIRFVLMAGCGSHLLYHHVQTSEVADGRDRPEGGSVVQVQVRSTARQRPRALSRFNLRK